jgi:hypothetical protein
MASTSHSARYRGRHRVGLTGLVHCRALQAMAAALRARKSGWRPARHDLASVAARQRQAGTVTPLTVPVLRERGGPSPAARLAA